MDIKTRLLGLYAEKDRESVILECDTNFLQYTGAKRDQIIGHTDFDFVWQEYAPLYRKHEIEIMSGNEYSAIIPVKEANGETLLFLHNKVPKKNENGEVTGLIVHACEIINANMHALISMLSKVNTKKEMFARGKKINQVKLSPREEQCLFYLIYGKTAKAIANILKISPRTVETYIEHLKVKFKCHTKMELIDQAIHLGYAELIPPFHSIQELVDGLKE